MNWFWQKARPQDRDYQREQIGISSRRVSEENTRKLDIAEADMSAAVEGAKAAIDRRRESAGPLKEALDKLIERQSQGRFKQAERN